MKSSELVRLVSDELDDLKGQSIRSINVRKLTSVTDYMLIVTGRSNVHVEALCDAVVRKVRRAGHEVLGVEGRRQAEWVLVDAGNLVVHVMLAPLRALYNLEDLWGFDSAPLEERESGAS